jgi:hypothetical protein
MKALRLTLIKTIAAASLLIGLSNAALARTGVYVRAGFGHPGFYHNYYPAYRFYHHPYYFGPPWRYYYPYRGTIIVGGGYWYDWGPDYYVVTPPVVVESPPVVIEKVPVVIERPTVVAQPQPFDEGTLELNKNLQNEKSELLKMLQMPNKEQRKEAIKELAGFSFDDNVRQALENVLLSDPDAQLRIEAAQSFSKVKNTKALAALEKARVEDPNEDVRKTADQTIKKLEGN